MNECVYNLIPDPVIVAERAKRHTSKFNSSTNGAPSYSTFPNKSVVADRPTDGSGAVTFQRPMISMGKSVAADIDPTNYLKAGNGVKFAHSAVKKERIVRNPDVNQEKPVMNLTSDKDFVKSNAVEIVNTAPKGRKVPEVRPTERISFGKVPKYLETVKAGLAEENSYVSSLKDQRNKEAAEQKSEYVRQLSEEDRVRLVAQLKERWEDKHRQYIAQPFARDTMMQIHRKELVEKELKEIEQALEKLSKQVVYIYKDEAPYAEWARTTAVSEAQKAAIELTHKQKQLKC